MSQDTIEKYIGVDLHKKTCYITVMNKSGQIEKQTEIANDAGEIDSFFSPFVSSAKVAVESTLNWIPFFEQIESLGCDIVLSNPLQTKAVAAARIKNDKVDSKILADLLRTDFLPLSYVQPRDIRDLKELIRQRVSYVELRTRIKNRIHSVLFKTGLKHEFTNLFGKAGRNWLIKLDMRPIYRQELNRYLTTLDYLDGQVNELSSTIELTAKADYDCRLLMTIPGIGFFSALVIKSEIGDINRFANGNKLCSYAGLIPSTYASAEKVRHGRITKRGSKWLRTALIDAVTSGSRNNNKLSVFYKKLKKNKGTGKAKVATARKMCSIIFAMLSDKQPFKEFVPVKQR